MKKLFIITFIVVLILIAAFTGFWFYQANQIKQDFITSIKDFEEAHHNSARIHYDTLDVKGFPCQFDVVIKNPHLQMLNSQDAILKSASEAYVKGTVVLGSNLIGTKVWIESDGDAHFMVPRPSKDTSSISEVVLAGKVRCELIPMNGINFSGPENLENINFADLHDVKIIFDKFAIFITVPTSEKLVDIEKGHITYHSDLKPENRQVVTLTSDLIEETNAKVVEKLLKGHLHQKYALENTSINGIGKIAIQVDSQFSIPQWPILWEYLSNSPEFHNLPDFTINFSKLNMQGNDIQGTNSLNLSIKNNGQDAKAIHLAFSHNSENSPAYNVKFKDALRRSLEAEFNKAKDNDQGSLGKSNSAYLNIMRELVNSPDFEKLIPNLPKTQISELNAKANISRQLDFKKPWEISIDKYILKSENSGITMQGNIKNEKNIHGKTTLELINYPSILNNSVEWYNKMAAALNPILAKEDGIPIKNLMAVTPPKSKAIDVFLRSISDNPDQTGTDLAITFNFEDLNNIKVGKLGIFQLLMAWQQFQGEFFSDQTN